MSAIAPLAVSAVVGPVAIGERRRRSEITAFRALERRLLSRIYRFLDDLPRPHRDVDLEVLKRVPTPV